jgi:hypothetical protein
VNRSNRCIDIENRLEANLRKFPAGSTENLATNEHYGKNQFWTPEFSAVFNFRNRDPPRLVSTFAGNDLMKFSKSRKTTYAECPPTLRSITEKPFS